MSPSLDGPRLKLARAREHFKTLHDRVKPFEEAERRRVTTEFNPDTSCQDFWLDPTPSPPEWGPLFGDVLYNCRSALDHLANQLAGGKLNDRTTAWPILTDPLNWPKYGAPYVIDMDEGGETFVKDSQPYNRGNTLPKNDVLAVLNGLSNADKHRHLHVGVVAVRTAAWSGDIAIQDFFVDPVDQRTKLASAPVTGPEMKVPVHFMLRVAFAQYRRWQMPIEVCRFFEEAIQAVDALFIEAITRGLMPP